MGGSNDLDFALCSLLLNKVKEKPEPVRVDAVVNLLEEVEVTASLSPFSSVPLTKPRKRRVPSDAL